MSDLPSRRALLRQKLRQQRRAVSPQERQRAGEMATEHLWTLLDRIPCRCVAAFASLPEEIDTAPLLAGLLQRHKTLVLPCVLEKNAPLSWAVHQEHAATHKGVLGIHVPPPDAPQVQVQKIDLFIVPCVAVDRCGNRLGMGGGYYDRSLALSTAPRIGMIYDFQLLESLETAPWDQKLSAVISPHYCLRFDHSIPT